MQRYTTYDFRTTVTIHRQRKKAMAALMPVFFLLTSFSIALSGEREEYSVKAAFLYKFTYYIDWNTNNSNNEFVIGILGPSPIHYPLSLIAKTETAGGKKISIVQFNHPSEITGCQILFIPANNKFKLDDILAKTDGKGILRISEKEGFAGRGTDINFVEEDSKLRFEINLKALQADGLKASSKLLNLAIIIN